MTWSSLVTRWTVDWPALCGAVVVGVAYTVAVRRCSSWPRTRSVSFAAGLLLTVLLTCSGLGVYDDTLFWVRAVQNVALLMVVPLLLAMGAPLTAAAQLLSAGQREALGRWGRGDLARALTFPVVVTGVLMVPMYVLYLTPLYDLTLRHESADAVARLVLLCCGFVYFWTRLQVDPTPRQDTHLVSFAISLVEVIADAGLGLVLWFGPLRAAEYYTALHRAWGPDVRTDQIIGAGVLWIGGDIAGLPFIGALFLRWIRADEREAKRVDAQLDERAVAGVAAAPSSTRSPQSSTPAAGDDPAPEGNGLWWEQDPRFRGRYRS
ncbi:cytochrome c oxidase assembly protein [Kineococcus sp. NPDC059986]|uniref:cytochrome c oxidase assembly protein n=1 Tax=Kineococcus sp. NPDC059986 TaxID=3155538 RepID=UPI00344DABF9